MMLKKMIENEQQQICLTLLKNKKSFVNAHFLSSTPLILIKNLSTAFMRRKKAAIQS